MVNGLPTSAVNITLDGMNIQDNYAKTWDGMFTRVSPRLDAVEEVTISTAAQGADMAGQGGVQMKFVTRSGTNKYQGSAYYYLRRDWMNTNTWFNMQPQRRRHRQADAPSRCSSQYQPGFRIGGPVWIPRLWDGRDKMFFFVNYEWVSSPGTNSVDADDHEPALRAGPLPVLRRHRGPDGAGGEERPDGADRPDDREAAGRRARRRRRRRARSTRRPTR